MPVVSWLCRSCAGARQCQTQPFQPMGDQWGELVDVLVAQGIISHAGTTDAGSLSQHPPNTMAWRGLVESSLFVLARRRLSSPLRGLMPSKRKLRQSSSGFSWSAMLSLRRAGEGARGELLLLWWREVRGVLGSVSPGIARVAASFRDCLPVAQQRRKAGFPALFFCITKTGRFLAHSLKWPGLFFCFFFFTKRSNVLLLINIFLASCFLCWPQCSSAEWRGLSPSLSFATSILHGPDLLPLCPSPWTVFGTLQQFQTSGKRLCTAFHVEGCVLLECVIKSRAAKVEPRHGVTTSHVTVPRAAGTIHGVPYFVPSLCPWCGEQKLICWAKCTSTKEQSCKLHQ